MIDSLQIHGFKRFQDATFAFGAFTVLAGLNGSGKTSLLQALLLVIEAARVDERTPVVQLNGPYGLELGTIGDVRNRDSDKVGFSVAWSAESEVTAACGTWWLGGDDDEALHAEVVGNMDICPFAFGLQPRAMQYLCAERLGPRSVLGSAPLPSDRLEIGPRGEYCAQILATLGTTLLVDARRWHPEHKAEDSPLLKYEAERWLSRIARQVELDAEVFSGTAVTALRFRVPDGNGSWVRAPNMGFGVTYALPVVLAGLLAPKGGLLIVENPEAHLHPAGQSAIGTFLAQIAAAGVQVVVETHSDHVLNGVRRAIGEHHILSADQAVVHFFDVDGTAPQKLTFTDVGGLSEWPPKFFDQFQIDVAALTRVRRPR